MILLLVSDFTSCDEVFFSLSTVKSVRTLPLGKTAQVLQPVQVSDELPLQTVTTVQFCLVNAFKVQEEVNSTAGLGGKVSQPFITVCIKGENSCPPHSPTDFERISKGKLHLQILLKSTLQILQNLLCLFSLILSGLLPLSQLLQISDLQ